MRSKKIVYLLMLLLVLTGCKEKTFTVTFDTLGGNILESITLNKGDVLDNIEKPTKDGYLFVNWLKDGLEYDLNSPVTEDITLTAGWIKAPEIYNYYKVTFITDETNEKITVKENDLVEEIEPPEKENYIFLGWYVGEEKFDFNNKITKDITLVAKYELNIVTVTYDLDGGLGLALETVPKNTLLTIPETPTKPGAKFLKWTLNGKEFSFDTKITENITLKAVWETIEYVKVSFDTDGGDSLQPYVLEKHSKIDVLPIPEKPGYKFIGWQIENELFNIDTNIEKDITLKAVYEKEINISEGE